MKKNFYAVVEGNPTGIFTSWDECKKAVNGYPNAIYKGFKTIDEAKDFLINRGTLPKTEPNGENTIHLYTDGSYNPETQIAGYAGVFVFQNEIVHTINGSIYDINGSRNVAGEIKAVEESLKELLTGAILFDEETNLIIHHDYLGVGNWITNKWRTNTIETVTYKETVSNIIDELPSSLNISFEHVKGHSGNKFNDKADELAKTACNMK